MQPRRSTVGLCAFIGLLSATLGDAFAFLFISAPHSGAIHASRLLTAVEQSQNAKMSSKKLTGTEDIKQPRGLAVDSLRKILYVIDGNEGKPKLYAVRLYLSKSGDVACEAPKLIADGLTSNWVAVDFRGKVFFVASNQILSLPAIAVTRKLDDGAVLADAVLGEEGDAASEADKVPVKADAEGDKADKDLEMLYNGEAIKGVNAPHGIAVDGYRVFWANGENGKQDGTIVQGLEEPMGDVKVTSLAANLAMAHGVCLTSSRVFFTDEEANLFSTKTNGGPATVVTDKLQKPRGCVFDGDGTVFVADEGDNKVLSFAGAGAELGPRRLSTSLTDITEPYGLAILHGNREQLDKGGCRSAALLTVVIATVLSLSL